MDSAGVVAMAQRLERRSAYDAADIVLAERSAQSYGPWMALLPATPANFSTPSLTSPCHRSVFFHFGSAEDATAARALARPAKQQRGVCRARRATDNATGNGSPRLSRATRRNNAPPP